MSLAHFNRSAEPQARRVLADCCAAPAWVGALLAGRPYRSVAEVLDRSDTVLESLRVAELEQAVAAHPRLGRPPTADGVAADWSRREQAGVIDAETDEKARLAAESRRYEERFGRVFLLCATGLSAGEVAVELRRRLGNTAADELVEVRRELGRIARLRLARMLG